MTDLPTIGIDFGTSYSSVAVWEKNKGVRLIPNDFGSNTTPSIVAFTVPKKKGDAHKTQRIVGAAALNQSTRNPTNTIFNIKRLLGR